MCVRERVCASYRDGEGVGDATGGGEGGAWVAAAVAAVAAVTIPTTVPTTAVLATTTITAATTMHRRRRVDGPPRLQHRPLRVRLPQTRGVRAVCHAATAAVSGLIAGVVVVDHPVAEQDQAENEIICARVLGACTLHGDGDSDGDKWQ